MTRAAAAAVLALIAALVIAPGAQAACQKTSLPAVQEEVMCLICGVPLVNAGGPQAEDERNFIRALVDKCRTKEQIKTALVAEYGEGVLAVPKKSGFDLAAYLVPILGGLLALAAVVLGAIGWRRAKADAPAATAANSGASDADLDEDLQRYDL